VRRPRRRRSATSGARDRRRGELARSVTSSPRGGDGRFRIDVGQAIQGSVNGGGPEFELRTFAGNIYLRKGAQ
jgi:hypothetical protein